MSQYKYKKPDPPDEKQKQRPKSKKYKLKQNDQQDKNHSKYKQDNETLPNTSRSNIGFEVAPFFGVVSNENKESLEPHSPNFINKLSQNFKQMRVRARNMGPNNKLQQINSIAESNYSSVLETKNSLNLNSSSVSNKNHQRVENTTHEFTNQDIKKKKDIEESKNFKNLNTDTTFEVNMPDLNQRKKIQQDKQAHLGTKTSKVNYNAQNQKIKEEEIKSLINEDTNSLQRRKNKSYTISKTLIKAAIGQQMEKSMQKQNSISSPLSPSEKSRLRSNIFSNVLSPLQSPLKSPLTNQSPNKIHSGSKSLGFLAENTSEKEDSEDDELPNDPANNLGDFVKFQKAKLLNDIVEKQGKNLSSIDQEIV